MPRSEATNRIDAHLGKRLREMRIARDLTEVEMAKRLDIEVSQLRDHEAGIARINPARLFVLARLLDVPISAFFEGLQIKH